MELAGRPSTAQVAQLAYAMDEFTATCLQRSGYHQLANQPPPYSISIFELCQSLGTTVFRGTRNFEPSRGICPLPRNFYISAEFRGIWYWLVIS